MNIFKLIFELFLLYLAYKLVFDFIIPVYKTTKQMKQKMQEMQQKMEEHQRRPSPESPKTSNTGNKSVAGDYIEYEEVK